MKKKTYFQNNLLVHISLFLIFLIALLMFGFSIYISVKMLPEPIKNKEISEIISGILLIIANILIGMLFIVIIIGEESYVIHMDSEKIWMNDDKKTKRLKLQYKTEACFSEIKEISMIKNEKDSRLQGFPKNGIYPGKQRYLALTMKSGDVVRMNVSNFTKNYIGKIISEIIKRINATGNTYEGQYPLWIINHITSE